MTDRPPTEPSSGRFIPWPLIRKIAIGLAAFAAAGVVALLVALLAIRPAPPDLTAIWERQGEPSITILDQDDQLVMTRGARQAPIVPLAEMPPHLWQAFLSIEDRRFYEHGPVDPIGILRAISVNMQQKDVVQGGSTITQQLAKNLFLTPERTLVRKIQEAFIASWLEKHLSKDAILALYLNRVYLGAGNYGVESASRFYFNKSARDVTLAEAAMLAGLPKAPSRLAPTSDLPRAQERARTVLRAMVSAGFVSQDDIAGALKTPAVLNAAEAKDTANYFVDSVLDNLWEIAGQQDAAGWRDQNLIVHTTFDPKLQLKAELAVLEVLDDKASTKNASQAALVCLDRMGAVRALVGGKSYTESQYNRATRARRQPGSAFKPFVYLAALERGETPYSTVEDAPLVVDGWTPKNYEGGYAGLVTYDEALRRSLNTAAIRVSESVGRQQVIDTARRAGIVSPIAPVPSLALGTAEVSLIELTSAYEPFFDDGYPHPPFFIRQVTTDQGAVLYRREDPAPSRAIAGRYAQMMTSMLEDVVQAGTGQGARLSSGQPAAGKTGTTSDYKDAWFIGYTPQLLTGVWVGNDDARPMEKVVGGALPAHLWRNFMDRALAGQEIVAFAGEANPEFAPEAAPPPAPAYEPPPPPRRPGPKWLPWNWFGH